MKRKNVMTILMCAACIGMAAAGASSVVLAQETEVSTDTLTEDEIKAAEDELKAAEADVTEDTDAENDAEAGTDAGEDAPEQADEEESEPETEMVYEKVERPDYKALDYVELGEYKGLTVELQPIEVTEDEIVNQIRVNAGSDILEELTEGTVGIGDIANIDYEGKLDGVAFDGGTAKGYDLEIGSGTFIPGFEDGLVGVKTGETVDVPLTFPENYTAELAGKDVIFTVTVNSIKRMPELTSELISKVTDGEYTDLEVYKETIRSQIQESKEASQDSQIISELLMQIANASTIKEYPQELLDYGMANMRNAYKQMAEYYNMGYTDLLEAYLGLTEDQFEEQALLAVKQNLQSELYLKAIAEKEGLEVSDADYEEGCTRYLSEYGYSSKEELVAAFGEPTIRISILQDKVVDLIRENASIIQVQETESETSMPEGETGAEANESGTEAGAEANETEAVTEAVTEAGNEAVTEAGESETAE